MQRAGARMLWDDDHDSQAPPVGRRLHLVGEADQDDVPAQDPYAPAYAENGRRTVKITGHPLPPRRRPSVAQSQIQARPDRIALWAFVLGLFLVFMAVATAHAASV